jgi:hypothetical protein
MVPPWIKQPRDNTAGGGVLSHSRLTRTDCSLSFRIREKSAGLGCALAEELCADQCSGSMTFWCGSGSFYFRHWPSRRQQKTNFRKVLMFFTFEGTFTSFFKDKKSKRSHKTVGIQVFLTIFAWWQKDPDPFLRLVDADPIPGCPNTTSHLTRSPGSWAGGAVTRVGNFRQKNNSAEDGRDGTNGYFRRNFGCSAEQKILEFRSEPFRGRENTSEFRSVDQK